MSCWHELFGCDRDHLPVAGSSWAAWRQAMAGAAAEAGVELWASPETVASPAFVAALAEHSVRLGSPVQAEVALGELHDEFGPNALGGPGPVDGKLVYDLVVGGRSEAPRTVAVDQLSVASRSPQPGRMARPLTAFEGDRFVWAVDHWSDLLVANLLALQARTGRIEGEVAATAEVHPTAVVEDSVVGPGATIGPFAVVRSSEVGAGCLVDDHASVRGSILGDGTVVQPQALVHGSAVGPGTVVSFQTAVRGSVLFGHSTISAPVVARSVIGPDSFLARGVSLSASNLTDSPIAVRVGARSVATGSHLLGCAIGRGARIGNGITIPAGYTVPADTYLVERPLPRVPAHPAPATPLLLDGNRFRPLPTLTTSQPTSQRKGIDP